VTQPGAVDHSPANHRGAATGWCTGHVRGPDRTTRGRQEHQSAALAAVLDIEVLRLREFAHSCREGQGFDAALFDTTDPRNPVQPHGLRRVPTTATSWIVTGPNWFRQSVAYTLARDDEWLLTVLPLHGGGLLRSGPTHHPHAVRCRGWIRYLAALVNTLDPPPREDANTLTASGFARSQNPVGPIRLAHGSRPPKVAAAESHSRIRPGGVLRRRTTNDRLPNRAGSAILTTVCPSRTKQG
jgi:hypothetical protein